LYTREFFNSDKRSYKRVIPTRYDLEDDFNKDNTAYLNLQSI